MWPAAAEVQQLNWLFASMGQAVVVSSISLGGGIGKDVIAT
jgi:hypothetical protein